jgi:hypothetical protein
VSNTGAEAGAASQLKSGNSIYATLVKPVDARKNKPGDPVVARTTEDVKSEGKVVIPRGSKIVGHVTEVKTRGKGQAESVVGVVFDHAVLKDGSQVPLSLAVQAVGSGATAPQVEDDSLMSSGNAATSGSVSGAGSGMTRTGGVVGLRDLSLASSASNSNSGTFTSKNSNVHLDSGTQMILRVQK